MPIRLQSLMGGQPVTAHFHGSRQAGTEPRDQRVIFVGVSGMGDDAEATFQYSLWNAADTFTVSRRHGRWRFEPTGEIFTVIDD